MDIVERIDYLLENYGNHIELNDKERTIRNLKCYSTKEVDDFLTGLERRLQGGKKKKKLKRNQIFRLDVGVSIDELSETFGSDENIEDLERVDSRSYKFIYDYPEPVSVSLRFEPINVESCTMESSYRFKDKTVDFFHILNIWQYNSLKDCMEAVYKLIKKDSIKGYNT